jgi:hypothetical protein
MDKLLATQQDLGLQHANVEMHIAEHLIVKGKAEQAVKYAESAGATAAQWAMEAAAIANERAGHFAAAEKWMRDSAEQYDEPLAWFQWCVRTGHGDLAAAREVLAKRMAGLDISRAPRKLAGDTGMFLVLDGKPVEAIPALLHTCELAGDQRCGLHVVFAAPDAATRKQAMDAMVRHAAEGNPDTRPGKRPHFELARWINEHWDDGPGAKLDLSFPDTLARDSVHLPRQAQDIYYFTARLLRHLGREDDAITYFKRAAAILSIKMSNVSQALAWQELRAKGIDPASLPVEPPPGHDRVTDLLRQE